MGTSGNDPTSLIAVDIGNSSIKLGFFPSWTAGEMPLPVRTIECETKGVRFADLAGVLSESAYDWCVCSVNRDAERKLASFIGESRGKDRYHLLTCRNLAIEIDVEHPEKVGIDRLAAALAANRLRDEDQAAIIIDAGTAITVDLLSQRGAFQGGAILPGFRMSATALREKTDLLPLTHVQMEGVPPPVVGKSTEAAICSGLFWGSVGGIREVILRMKAELQSSPQVFVTGGDARRLPSLLDERARYLPHLVLSGIALSAPKH